MGYFERVRDPSFPTSTYLEIWKRMYQYNNVLHFSIVKLERMFSRMAPVKNDWHNRLKRKLDALLQIGEEGPEIDLDANESIDHWFNDRACRLSSKNHSYPEKRQHLDKSSVVNIAMLAFSDLEDDESQGSMIRGIFMKHFVKYRESIFL